jgi:GDP-4-dehydro-6-deoxy-D-mannose reductase
VTRRALVTGGNGFVAQYVMRAMLDRGWAVTAAGVGALSTSDVLSENDRARIAWRHLDITTQHDVSTIMKDLQPDVIVHLAGISHVPDALANPAYAYEVNTVGAVRLLAEVRRQRDNGTADPVVLVVGSAEQYGRHELNEMPLHETAEQRPLTLYAGSKVAQEVAALQAFRSDGIRVVCTRSFNHSGAGHGAHFLLPSLVARAMALAPTGGRLLIGNGDTVRDFLHVFDVAEAYLALVERGIEGDAYNVCSGEGTSIRSLAGSVLLRLGVQADIGSDPSLTREVDVPTQVGSNRKLRDVTGWTPRRTRDDIIDDLIHAATR